MLHFLLPLSASPITYQALHQGYVQDTAVVLPVWIDWSGWITQQLANASVKIVNYMPGAHFFPHFILLLQDNVPL